MHPDVWHPDLVLIVYVLAVHRVTRLIIADRITAGLRTRLAYADPARPATLRPRLAYFVGCPWCVSMWVGAVLAVAGWAAWPVAAWVFLVLAASSVTGLLGMRDQ